MSERGIISLSERGIISLSEREITHSWRGISHCRKEEYLSLVEEYLAEVSITLFVKYCPILEHTFILELMYLTTFPPIIYGKIFHFQTDFFSCF